MFETTLANSVAVNAHAQFDDTKYSAIKTVTTSFTHVDHRFDRANHANGHAKAILESEIEATPITQITVDIESTTVTPTTKDPLVAGNRQQFQSTTEEDDSVLSHSTTVAIPLQSTIDHVIKSSDEIPSKRQPTDNFKKNAAENVSSTLDEMVSSTLSNAIASSHTEKTIHNSTATTTTSTFQQSNHHGNLEINSSKSHLASAENSWLMGKSNNNRNSYNPIVDDNDSIKKSIDYVNGHIDDDSNDYVNSDIQLPQADAPSISNGDIVNDPHQADLMKPRSDAVYFVVAVIGGAKVWARTLARTLHELGPPFSGDPLGSPLRPIYVDLPTNGR